MSRRGAREVALKTLFVLDFAPEAEVETTMMTAKEDVADVSSKDMAYSKALIEGTKAHEAEIDNTLGQISQEWEVSRMSAVDRNILRLISYELFYGEEKLPASVGINEAVELAKLYGSDDSPSFINGLLGAVVRKNEQ